MKTITKRQLLEMLSDVSDDANVYVMTHKSDASLAVKAATGDELCVFLLGGNTALEADGVSLVADFDVDRKWGLKVQNDHHP